MVWALGISPSRLSAVEPALNASQWETEIKAFEVADKTNSPPKDAILFVGSSSIRLWKDLAKNFSEFKIIQRGFGGSEISDVTAFAPRIVIPYRPRQVVLYAGDNDIASSKSPERILNDFKSLVAAIHGKLPNTTITFISIKPSPSRWKFEEQVKQANALIKNYAVANTRLEFIDVFTLMLAADGKPRPELFLADNLHMNRKGYDLWVTLIKPHFQLAQKAATK